MPRPTLHLAQPCTESWAAMTPTSTGRHCAACQKTVVDFTHKTDAEILAQLARATSSTCGRFRREQVGRPLLRPTPASSWRLWLSAVLAVGSVLCLAKARAQPSHALHRSSSPTATSPALATRILQEAKEAGLAPSEPITLRGTVRAAATGGRLPGVTIRLKGSQRGCTTDADGNFALALGAETTRASVVISAVGYETIEKIISLKHRPKALRFQLKTSHTVLGEIAYTKPAGGFFERLNAWRART